jgi:hypothetical protein
MVGKTLGDIDNIQKKLAYETMRIAQKDIMGAINVNILVDEN